eukprot:TRINITY_DN4896_c0_g2_i4.p1 TRINITY_DN4896_c0_g2~~TRINITY_DN4896_c0_g2_i4.p1  ORF type:complete len:243 (-),score=27.66 TRINITY_DN4896_c0_g2_i4:135-863(-)
MEFVQGFKVDDREGIERYGLSSVEVAKTLIDIFGKMLFIDGHVHCDAHPGNILIRRLPQDEKRAQIVLLDHGFYRSLSDEFRKRFCEMWVSLVTFDNRRLKRVCAELGIGDQYKFLPLVFLNRTRASRKKLGDSLTYQEWRSLHEDDVLSFERINGLLQSLPPDMMYVIRASNLVASHNLTLGGKTRDRLLTYTDMALKALYPNRLKRAWAKFMFYIRVFLFERANGLFQRMFPSFTLTETY